MATEVDNADQMQSSNEATDKEKPATDLAGSNPLSEEEMAESEAYRVELSTRYGQLDALLLGNENPSECADFPPFAKNDSSLKRNTAFVKKLKNYTESQRDAIMRELPALNLSKYLEEVANALLEAKLKSSDLSSILLINCLLARNYAEYAELALDAWRKVLLPKQQQPKESQQNQWNLAKLRVDLRLYSDLIFAKVLPTMPALKLLGQCLQALTLNDADFSHCGLVCHLLSHSGDSLIGQLPTRKLALANRCSPAVELPRGTHYLEAETKRPFYRLLTEYGKRLTSSLTDRAGELSRMDRQNRRILNSKGELSQDRRDAFETCKKEVDRLLGLANQLCNLLGEPAPELPPIESDDLDEEERAVADSLSAPAEADTEAAEDDEAALERELLEEEEQQAAAAAAPAEPDSVETTDATSTSATAQQDDDEESAVLTSQPAAPAQTQTQRQAQLEQFLTALPTLVNRDMIDKAAVEFATGLNSKSARRRLSHAMLTVHRSRSDLLPFYARLAAVLQPVAPEVAQELRQRLQADFRHAFHKKDHTNLESKLKTVRFIGELVKFGLFPLADAAADLKLLIINFSHHSIELACTLLESCGRYLYATPETHLRIKVYLRNLWNKKTKMVTDERLSAMIENAYYSVAPPDANSRRLAKVVLLPPMMQFLQRLLFKDLCNSTVEKVLNLCLRLPWTDPEISQFAVRCFTSVWCIPYSSVHCLASVLAGLAPYQPSVAIAVVDNVLEDIRLGMEINETRLNQRRIACSRYLGELYNYCLVESGLIFNTLHSFISFGVDLSDPTAPEQSSPPPAADYISLDPPEHLLRIRLSCVLLQTCGQYFDTGSNKKRLDAYLLYLQQYYWSKRRQLVWSSEDRPFPLDIEYLYTETVDSLRPKFKHANNFQEARLFVDKQEKAFLAKLERVAAKLQQQSDTAARGEDDADRASSNSATPQRRQSPRPELMACPEDEEFIRAFERTLAVEGGGGVGSGVGGGVGGPP
uniref:MIF4G domain-containing protein n=1 Tax=Macrostomum lignano TaxID=282301 RepID=A0A1I8G8B3_9PLAT